MTAERKFGSKSRERLNTCDVQLQVLCEAVLQEMDITVLCGHRNEVDQNAAFKSGNSKVQFPNSKHNSFPSKAVDIAPYPTDWNDIKKFEEMCKLVERVAEKLGIEIKLGRDFSFKDYPHIELREIKK